MKAILFMLAIAGMLTLSGCDIEVDAQLPGAESSYVSLSDNS